MDVVAVNLDALIDGKLFALLLDCDLKQFVQFGVERYVGVVDELLLVDILPVFEIADLDVIHDDSHRKVAGFAFWDLVIFPSFEIWSLYNFPDALQDSVDQLDVEA